MDQWGRYDPAVDDLEDLENEDLSAISPGKRSLTSPLIGPAPGSVAPGKVTRSLGITTELPFQSEMEAAFDQDFSTVQAAHTTPEALGGSKGMAQGEHVAFSSASPSRQTVAHELAHVVQHRQGLTDEVHADDGDTALDRAANAMAAAATSIGGAMASGNTARARLPRPVVFEVIGDRFTVSLAATATNELEATIIYQGPYMTSGADVRNGSVKLSVKRAADADQAQPLNTQVLMVKADGLVFDLMGNGQEIAELRFSPAGHEDDADARTHTITSWTNGDHSAGTNMNILLPTEGRPAPEGLSAEEQARIGKATASINLGPDTFTMSARRLGESNRVHLHFNSTNHRDDGYRASTAMEVPTATDGPVTLVILNQSETGFEADLDGDGHADVRVVHTASTSAPRADGSQNHTHYIDIYDLNGTRVDRTWFVVTGEEWNVPAAVDRALSPPPDGEPASGTTAPAQGDLPTEATEPTRLAGGDYEMRIDSDGDRYKDLVVRLSHPRPTDRIQITISQISSGKSATLTTPGDELNAMGTMNPRLVQIADGRNPLDILLYHQPHSGPGTHLFIDPPTDIDRGRVFDFRVSNVWGGERRAAALFDHETETHDDVSLASGVTPTAVRGNVPSFTARLGELGDPFLFTLEATSGAYTLGVSGMNDGAPAVSAGFTLRGIDNQRQFRPVSIGASSIGIDLTNNGEADITIHDGIGAPPEGLASRELMVERVHQMSLSGAAAQGEQSATFLLRGRHFQRLTHGGASDNAGRLASGAASATATFAQQEQEGHDLEMLLGRYQAGVSAQILQAGERGFISSTLVSTWRSLAEEMVRLDAYARMDDKPEEVANNERSVRESAAEHATTLYEELARETAGAIETTTYEDAETHQNPYTLAQFRNPASYDEHGNRQDNFIETFAGPAAQLAQMLRARRDDRAAFLWSRLQSGVERWAQKRLEEELGEDDPLVKQGRYMASMSAQLGQLRGKRNVQRVSASFIADESYRNERDFFPSMPLQLWVWEDEDDDGLWHICDLTNPDKKFDGESRHPYRRVNAAGDQSQFEPPHTLFQQLNDKKKFPKGLIRYQIADGQAGQVVCEAKKKWYEWVQEIGLGLAAIGLGLVSFGTGTVAVFGSYVLAASALAGAVAAGGEIADAAAHGWLDGTVLMINLLQIASSVASAGAIVAGNLARGAAAASNAVRSGQQGATLWTGNMAKLAAMGGKVYVPLTGTALVADAATVVVMSVDLMNKLKEIDDNIGNEEEARAAKVKLLAMFALTGGLTALSVKGDLPVIREGRINIVLDTVGGIPVAHAGGVRLGNAEVPVARVGADGAPIPDANLHATARWQNPEARARLSEDDVEWYQAWMRQDPKVRIGRRGEIEIIMPHIEGKTPPAGLEDRLKSIARSSDMAMLDSAWARTGELEALREANGGNLDIDPTSPAWVQERPRLKDKLTESLGSRRRAEEVLSSYEAIRTGAHGPGTVAHADQARKLGQILPDSEVDAMRRMFPEYEVYVSGSALDGASGDALGKVEVVVVVPNGTESDLMGAIEQRATATRLRPDPDYAQAHPPMTENSTLGVEAKVVTQDQFFGLATARVDGQRPLQLHRIDVPTGPGGTPYTGAELDAMNRSGYRYNPETGGFELRPAASRAALAGTSMGALRGANTFCGGPLPSEAVGQEVLRRLAAGEGDALRVVGVEPPDFPVNSIEWGLGQRTSDGAWVLIQGSAGSVNWAAVPGVRARGHAHPLVPGPRGRMTGPGGADHVTIDQLAAGQGGNSLSALAPSGSDFAFAAREGQHTVATPYVHIGGGRIANPRPGESHPPVVFEILSSVPDGVQPQMGMVYYRARVKVTAGGEVLYEGNMWGMQAGFSDVRFSRPEGLEALPDGFRVGDWSLSGAGSTASSNATRDEMVQRLMRHGLPDPAANPAMAAFLSNMDSNTESYLRQLVELADGGRVRGLDEWFQGLATNPSPDRIQNMLVELREARRMADDHPGSIIDLSADSRAPTRFENGADTQNVDKSFDIEVHSASGQVLWSSEIKTISDPIKDATDLTPTIRATAEKVTSRARNAHAADGSSRPIQGKKELRMEVTMYHGIEEGRRGEARLVYDGAGKVTRVDGDGNLLGGSERNPNPYNVFDKMAAELRGSNVNTLDRIVLVDSTGVLAAFEKQANNTWIRVQ